MQFAFVRAQGRLAPFSLVLMRPHRVFTESEAAASLLDLGLAPSAVLAVTKL